MAHKKPLKIRVIHKEGEPDPERWSRMVRNYLKICLRYHAKKKAAEQTGHQSNSGPQ